MSRIIVAALTLLALVGCERTQRGEFALYDWEAQRGTAGEHGVTDLACREDACPDGRAEHVYVFGAPKMTADDIDRNTIRSGIDPQTERPVVLAQFTPAGESRFLELTRTLAQRGTELGRPQHFLVVVDEEVYSAPYIDYRRNPDGIPGDNGIQIDVPTLKEARELAKALRG